MIEFGEVIDYYVDCIELAIKKGDLPKDVTPEESQAYMHWVYFLSIEEKKKK